MRLLTKGLADVRVWSLGAPVRRVAASSETIAAALEDGALWITSLRDGSEHRFAVGDTITALAVAPNGRAIALGTSNGDLIVVNDRYEIAVARVGRHDISCVAFPTDDQIVACFYIGRILRLQVSSLSFLPTQN